MNEDVFPIEHWDISGSHVSILTGIFSCLLEQGPSILTGKDSVLMAFCKKSISTLWLNQPI